jgi:hypothetical protein
MEEKREEMSLWGKMFSEPQYKFGEGIQMTKADITMTSQMYKYGTKPDYTRFKPTSTAEEVELSETATGATKVGKGVLKPESDVGIGQDEQIAGGWGTEALGGIVPEDTGISSYDEASGTTSLEAWEKELRKKLEGVEGYN